MAKRVANKLAEYYPCSMTVRLTAAERKQLRQWQWQKPRRTTEGYGKVTVLLRLDAGRPLATVVQDVGLTTTPRPRRPSSTRLKT